jgi:hypothetical protein
MALLRPRTRAVWLRLHRWLGLGLGAVFVLFGLTGSLMVFYVAIDEAIEPALAMPRPEPQVRSWQAVLDALQQAGMGTNGLPDHQVPCVLQSLADLLAAGHFADAGAASAVGAHALHEAEARGHLLAVADLGPVVR